MASAVGDARQRALQPVRQVAVEPFRDVVHRPLAAILRLHVEQVIVAGLCERIRLPNLPLLLLHPLPPLGLRVDAIEQRRVLLGGFLPGFPERHVRPAAQHNAPRLSAGQVTLDDERLGSGSDK
ncbi:MAG: hypothetical protein ACREIT_04570 [Tepidisphaeraceae bacterium]